jgi:hypothetical protein
MARSLTSVIRDQVSSDSVELAFLAKFRFDSGDLNVWTGIGDLTFSGDTYQGIGSLGTISSYKETQNLKAEGLTFTLSGNIGSTISTALDEEFQNRICTLWLGFFDNTVSPGILNDPPVIFQGRMDNMTIEHGSETSTVSVSAESILVSLENAVNRRYTSQEQALDTAADFPGSPIVDKGFDFVATLEDKQFVWGAPDPEVV